MKRLFLIIALGQYQTDDFNEINHKIMKTLVKLFSLSVCIILLCTSCHKKKIDKESEIHVGLSYSPLTCNVESSTNSYIQVSDSVYNFNSIEGMYYSHKPTSNNYVFNIGLKDTERRSSPFITFDIFTEVMDPELFFQKGIFEINTMCIHNEGLSITDLFYCKSYYDILSIFTWDTIFYENGGFQGKGSLEIKDTLYTKYSNIYYPPQKIEFEFK
jgi:hypothetical protein